MNDTALEEEQLAKNTYTPAELSYLLAGRGTPEAKQARAMLGLAEMHEGDEGIGEAIQSLKARGLVGVDDAGDAELEQSTKVVGYALGTATDWTRLSVRLGSGIEVIAVLSAPGIASALVLRRDSFGNFQAVATKPGVHGSQIVGAMVSGYLTQGPKLAISVRRDVSDVHSVLVLSAETSTDTFVITHREGIADAIDVPEGTELTVDREAFLANLETLLNA